MGRSDAGALIIAAAGVLLRLHTWSLVFFGGRYYSASNDGWYHMRRARMILEQWPRVPQFDSMVNAPYGGTIPWTPLFDFLVATMVLPWRGDPKHALELVSAFLPPILGGIQIFLLYLLMRTLFGTRAALIAAATAAVLPGMVRYTRIGALDHDPLYEIALLLALLALARSRIILLASALTIALLTWSGSLVLVGIIAAVLAIARKRELVETAARGCAIAAIAIVPFASRAPAFETLSLLHVAVIAGVALLSAVAAIVLGSRERTVIATAVVAGLAAILIVPSAIVPFARGVAYASGQHTAIGGVAETRPLLFVGDRFEPRAFLVWLTILPAIGIVMLIRKREPFLLGWLAVTFVLALQHMRFTYSAAAATCAFAGYFFDDLLNRFDRRRVAALACVIALPVAAAYVPLPGFKDLRFRAQRDRLRDGRILELLERLRDRPDGVVYAPWTYGHAILWNAEKPVVASPFLSFGQPNFANATRLWFERDPNKALAMLKEWRVRYVLVTPEVPNLRAMAKAAGVDPTPMYVRGEEHVIHIDRFRETIPGRLAVDGAFGPFVEIDRAPLARLYELRR